MTDQLTPSRADTQDHAPVCPAVSCPPSTTHQCEKQAVEESLSWSSNEVSLLLGPRAQGFQNPGCSWFKCLFLGQL